MQFFSQGTGLELPFVGFVVVNVAIDVAYYFGVLSDSFVYYSPRFQQV